MCTKAVAFLALMTIANGNDVIVGLKTDGKKFFDENRQANPALWRQMDNVTIKAPENEVIRRVVITDLRPEKDGDVKVIEGGEGEKNVTIELKSPTVLRGYEFHIEVYSKPEENLTFYNDQQSTVNGVADDSTTISNNPTTNLDTTSKLPDVSTSKTVPSALSNDDQVKDNERQGRNAKNEVNVIGEATTTESSSTTLKNDISTTLTSQYEKSTNENYNERTSNTPIMFEHDPSIPSIPLQKSFDVNPAIPAVSGVENDKLNVSNNDENRHVRDTEEEMSGKYTVMKLNVKSTNARFESSTENDKEVTTTEISDAKPVAEKSKVTDKDDSGITLKPQTISNRKYTSVISSKVDHLVSPLNIKETEKLRNVRGTNEEQKTFESFSTITPIESSTTDINLEKSTTLNDDCITTETSNVQNPINIGRGNDEDTRSMVFNKQWHQSLGNPTFPTEEIQRSPGNPAVLSNEQSTLIPDASDPVNLESNFKPSQDHMENSNPKISAIANLRDRNYSL